MRIRSLPLAAVVAATTGALVLTGCGAGNGPSDSERSAASKNPATATGGAKGGTSVQGAPVRMVADMELPFEAYELSPKEFEDSQTALWGAVRPCMVDLGFTGFDFAPEPVAEEFEEHEDLRYGTYRTANAEKYGYRPPFTVVARAGVASADGGSADVVGGKEPDFTAEEEAALDGVSPERTGVTPKRVTRTASGAAIPQGGCYGQALDEVTGGHADTYLNDTLVEELNGRAYDQSLTDPKVKAVFAQWSDCMKEAGHDYASPIDANNDPKWTGDRASKDEIAVATADTECKVKTNLVPVWHDAESAIQKDLVARHTDDLSVVKDMKQSLARNS